MTPICQVLKLISIASLYIKKLTRSEMVERRAKCLSYNDNEFYFVGRQCKKFFLLEVEQDDQMPTTKDDVSKRNMLYLFGEVYLQFELHAGSFSGRKVMLYISGRPSNYYQTFI